MVTQNTLSGTAITSDKLSLLPPVGRSGNLIKNVSIINLPCFSATVDRSIQPAFIQQHYLNYVDIVSPGLYQSPMYQRLIE